jgi:hypothetical protein
MPGKGLFLQNVIAVVWDFDMTLSPHYMQKPIFEAYGVDEAAFWEEVRALPDFYARAGIEVQRDTCYLGHLLSYVKEGRMADLTNAKLRELGGAIELFPGLPEFFSRLAEVLDKPEFRAGDLKLEHYIVSTGLEAMISGTEIAHEVDGIWASVFIEKPADPGTDLAGVPERGPISQIAGFLDNTTKTRALFEINKGVNADNTISVNDLIPEEERRVPFKNMIYVADGPSDIPSFSVLHEHGGLAYAVYDENAEEHYAQVEKLHSGGRVDNFGPANYLPGSTTEKWLTLKVEEIATRNMRDRKDATRRRVQPGPEHLPEHEDATQ